MTTQAGSRPSVAEVERALRLAVRAPSIHNSQPWRWVLGETTLDLRADRSRTVPAVDPDGRGLLVSCGAALHLARLGLRREGWQTAVTRVPDPADPDLLARITWIAHEPTDERTRLLAAAAADRHNERRPFRPDAVPAELLDRLRQATDAEGVYTHLIERNDERLDLAVAVSWADRVEADDTAYRDELARWVRSDAPSAGQGVPATAVPHLPPGQERHTDVPTRDFELGGPGIQATATGVDENPAWIVLFSTSDDPAARLRAGEAYARLITEAAGIGLATSASTQAVDLPAIRERVRVLMNWPDHPQMVVRVGWPPSGDPAPRTPRLPVAAVLTVTRASASP